MICSFCGRSCLALAVPVTGSFVLSMSMSQFSRLGEMLRRTVPLIFLCRSGQSLDEMVVSGVEIKNLLSLMFARVVMEGDEFWHGTSLFRMYFSQHGMVMKCLM